MAERIVGHGSTLVRSVAIWSVVTAGAIAMGALATTELASAPAALTGGAASDVGTVTFDRLLVWSCAAAALAIAAWLWLVTTVVALEAMSSTYGDTGPAIRALPGIPVGLRRALLAACGAAVAGGLATGLPATALATPGHLHEDRTPGHDTAAVAGLPLPDRPATAVAGGGLLSRRPIDRSISRPSPGAERRAIPATVTVRVGDSLWGLAREQLGSAAADAEVAARWRVTYRLNRAVIGPDPDLILPGQRLRLAGPGSSTQNSTEVEP